jgi:hypothetical protein
MLVAEKGRAATGKLLHDNAGLSDRADNLEAAGRIDRAIEAILLFWLVGKKRIGNKAHMKVEEAKASRTSPHQDLT